MITFDLRNTHGAIEAFAVGEVYTNLRALSRCISRMPQVVVTSFTFGIVSADDVRFLYKGLEYRIEHGDDFYRVGSLNTDAPSSDIVELRDFVEANLMPKWRKTLNEAFTRDLFRWRAR